MPNQGELLEAMISYFKDGGRPLDIVGIACDAWPTAISEIKRQGSWELDKLLQAKRV